MASVYSTFSLASGSAQVDQEFTFLPQFCGGLGEILARRKFHRSFILEKLTADFLDLGRRGEIDAGTAVFSEKKMSDVGEKFE